MLFTGRGRVTKTSFPSNTSDIDIKQISLDILRDLYAASRKLIMYPDDHPSAAEPTSKPLAQLNELFRFKKSFVIKTYNKRLVAEGLLLEDSVFVSGLFIDLHKHGIETLEIKSEVNPGDLYHLLKALILPQKPIEDYFPEYLIRQNVKTIIVNNPNSKTLFNFEDTVVGSPETKYSLVERASDILSNNPEALIAYYRGEVCDDDTVAAYFGIDLRYGVVKSTIAQTVSRLPELQALDIFQKAIFSFNWLDEALNDDQLNGLRQLWKDYSAASEDVSILLPIYNIFRSVGATDDILENIFDRGALLKLKAVRTAEEYIGLLKSSRIRDIDFQGLRQTVFKLATEQYSKTLELLLKQLLKNLLSDNLETRQRSLRLIIQALQALFDGSFREISGAFIVETLRITHKPAAAGGAETVELISWIIEITAEHNRWEELKICCQTLRSIAEDKADPRAGKARDFLADLAESSILIDVLVEAVISGKSEKELFVALAALKSPNISESLLNKISVDDKAVRARVIKALVSMGRAVGPDVTAHLAVLVGAGETDDDMVWYKLRNLLRVIGLIGYIEALPYLDVMVGWNQKRLKFEIIAACEAMRSASAGVVLSKLAVDHDREIRRSAIVAMGMTEHPDMVKFLREIFNDPRSEKALIAESLGRIKGPQARDLLIDLYENEDIYTVLGISKKDEEQIKLAILKALSKIGDDISKSKMKLYGSKDKSGLFKKDILSQAAKALLKNSQSI
jgi:hypothetical protein